MDAPAIDIVDSHVHIFTPELAAARDLRLTRDAWFGSLYENPRALLATAESLLDMMDRAGVQHAVACGFPWADLAHCREHNDYLSDVHTRFPDRISWLAIVPPTASGAMAEVARCFDLGAAGIGELNANAQGFDWRDLDALGAFAGLCVEWARPILLHASEPVGHLYPGKGAATPDKLLAFIMANPRLQIVAAHWGGGLPFHELMPEIEEATRNVVYDCAASTYLYRQRIFRAVLDIVGRKRVLFGSDYPVLTMDRFVRRVTELFWQDEDERRLVMGANARRVFNIPLAEGVEL